MTSNAHPGTRLMCSLRSANGAGVVRMEDRFDTDVDDLWSALTEPDRLARWYGEVEGDLRPGGEFRLHIAAIDWDGGGRVEACEPPQRLVVTTKEITEPYDKLIEAMLSSADGQTILVIEVHGMPLDKTAFYGAGWQIHGENLAAYLAGRERDDTEARWAELVPLYQDLATDID